MNAPPNPPGGSKSAEETRRNTLNMEKMIKKNVMAAGARPGGMKRGLAVVEFFKQQQQQQQQQQNSTHDDSESATKRAKKDQNAAATASSAPPGTSVRGSQATSSLVGPPATPLIPSAASAAIAASMVTQRGSPLRTSASSASAATRASPLRAAAVRASPLRSSSRASPLRQVFTSPSRRVVAPRLPEVTTSGGIHPTPVLNLDQLDGASATPLKPPTLPSKSPFQSFQSKLSGGASRGVVKTPSPARPSPPPARRATPITSAPQLDAAPLQRAASIGTVTSVGLVDLSEDKAATPEAPTSSPPQATPGSSAAHPVVLTTPPPKPLARNLFASTTKASVATNSLCFSTEGVASSLDVSPDGECIVVAFTDGSVRLYEMDSTVPSDRHGYLLGHLDEESNLSSAGAHLRVKITSDGRYAFVGCRTGPRVMMSIHLHHYRNGKDTEDDDMDQLQKTFHSNTRLRGFSTAMVVPTASEAAEDQPRSYYVLCGLGVGSLNLWQFIEPRQRSDAPEWKFLYTIQANGNTAVIARFLPQDPSSSLLQIAAKCEDKNMRVWNLERSSTSGDELSHHVVQSHYDISNSKDVTSFYGNYAYAIAPTGEACRFRIPSEPVAAVRTYFETERFEMGGGNSSASKSRRSNIILESIYASDDGQAVVAVSAEGIFYYTNQAPADGSSESGVLRIIGRNSSLNAQFKSPMKVYKPLLTKPSGETYFADAVMSVITNPQYEEDGEEGYVNVDLTETWAARWMKPSLGNDCWVCGVRNIRHWQADSSQPARPKPVVEKPQIVVSSSSKQSYRPSPSSASKPPTPKLPKNTATSSDSSPGSPVATGKAAGPSEAAARPAKPPASARSVEDNAGSSKKTKTKPAPVKRLDVDAASIFTSDDQRPQQEQLVQELARYKERYNQIVTEWQRRLKGERQMRRLWKQRETEFEGQLHETLVKLDDAEQQVVALREGQKDAEKKFIFEKLKAEQQSSVKVRYEQLCEQMQERMVALEQQQRLMEQTSRALLQEVDRHVQHTKQSVNGLVDRQQNECILCKDRTAVTAIVPCGHLCFCEEDADVYRRNFRGSEQITCPICQREMISMLRIY